MSRLLTWPDDSAKFTKGSVPIYGVSMLPHRLMYQFTGIKPAINMCHHSTHECRKYCLNWTGHGPLPSVQRGRAWKTDLLLTEPDAWFSLLWHELDRVAVRDTDARCRPNVFTDVTWEDHLPPEFWEHHRQIRFGDYTKHWARRGRPVGNYKVVFSVSEQTTDEQISGRIEDGDNVVVVFNHPKGKPFPKTYKGWPLCDGDVDDDLWSRPHGYVIGLRAKGALRIARSPFKRELE